MRSTRTPSAAALEEHAGFVRALARGLVLGADEVDDVVQETYLAALRSPPQDPRGLRQWMGVVAHRAGLKRHRSASRRTRREHAAARPETTRSTADTVADLDAHRTLVDAVQALREPYRSTIVMRYFHGQTPTEIARAVDAPVKTVETRLRRALEQLRVRLDTRHGGRQRWQAALVPLAAKPSAAWFGVLLGGVAAMTLKTKVGLALVTAALALAIGVGIDTALDDDAGAARIHVADEDGMAVLETWAPRETSVDDSPAAERVEALDGVHGTSGPNGHLRAPVWKPPPPPPGGAVVGAVTVDGGDPRPAEIELRLEGWLQDESGIIAMGTAPELTLHVSSDSAGNFGFYDLPHGIYTLTATAPGFVPARMKTFLVTPEQGRRQTPTLSRGNQVIVRVVDGRGDPVAGHRVRLESTSAQGTMRPDVVETDAAGVAQWSLLESGWYQATPADGDAWTPRQIHVDAARIEARLVTSSATPNGPAECHVVLGTEIAGRVTGPAGEPLVGARLEFGDHRDPRLARYATTNVGTDGRYRFAGMPAGTYGIRLNTTGFAAPGGSIDLRAGESIGHDIRVGATRIHGRVTREDTGAPFTKASVGAALQGGSKTYVVAAPDADGAFSLEGLAPGTYELTVRPWLSELEPWTSRIEVHANDERELDVVIQSRAPGLLRLMVTGRAPSGERISIHVRSPSGSSTSMGNIHADGTKELPLDRGAQTIIVRKNGVSVGEFEIEMPPGGRLERTFDLETNEVR